MLNDLIWTLFKKSGNVELYIAYRESVNAKKDNEDVNLKVEHF